MIICSCNIISKAEIQKVITDLLDEDMWQFITPGRVYQKLKKRGNCCGCFPSVVELIIQTAREYHKERNTPEEKLIPVINKIKEEHERCETARQLARIQKMKSAS